jgi:hypothetical protein
MSTAAMSVSFDIDPNPSLIRHFAKRWGGVLGCALALAVEAYRALT